MVPSNFCKYEHRGKRRALAASRKAASSVFTDNGDDEVSSIAVKTAPVATAPVQGDVRRVEYSAEMAEVGFPSRSRDGGCPLRGQQLKLNRLQPAREQLDLRLSLPKHSQSQSQSRYGDHRRGDQES